MGITRDSLAKFAVAVTSMSEREMGTLLKEYKKRLVEEDKEVVHQYSMGDRVVYVDAAGREHVGVVDKLNKRTVRIRDETGNLSRIPVEDLRGPKTNYEKQSGWVEIRS